LAAGQTPASVSNFLGQIDADAPETTPIRERLTEEADQLHRLATGAQERDRILALESMAEDINLTSRGRDDKERRLRTRSKRDSLAELAKASMSSAQPSDLSALQFGGTGPLQQHRAHWAPSR
jgi:hypothetical protein